MDGNQLLRKINNVAQNRGTKLNIKNSKINWLPPEISTLETLEELIIEKNYIKTLPLQK